MTDLWDGYSVELLRSCYYSVWHLPGSARPLEGRFCFSSKPVFQGPIFPNSRNYTTSEEEVNPPQYGELLPPVVDNHRPYFKGRCADPWRAQPSGEGEGGALAIMGGGEAQGGLLFVGPYLVGGEGEGGTLYPVAVIPGGEAEGGALALNLHLVGGEAEGGDLVAVPELGGGEAEGGTYPRIRVTYGGGEAEGGLMVGGPDGAQMEGESGPPEGNALAGGEGEGGDLIATVIGGGEAEGGTLFTGGLIGGGEAEGGTLPLNITLAGGEAEGGDVAPLPTVALRGGEAEGFRDIQSLFSPDLWLDGRLLQDVQGNPLSTWFDRSGNANDATWPGSGTQPIFDPVGSGRTNGVYFAANATMQTTRVVGTGSACTCYAVLRADGTDSGLGVCFGSLVNFGQAMSGMTNDPFSAGNTFAGGPSSWTGLTNGLDVSTNPGVFSSRQDGSDVTVNLDGFLAGGSTNSTGNPPMQLNWIMGRAFGGRPAAWLYELLFYERAVSDEEDALILFYLMTKWNIPPY